MSTIREVDKTHDLQLREGYSNIYEKKLNIQL